MERESSSKGKGTVCVTGGTGFFGSWLIFKLLEHGYYVHTTIRASSDHLRDVSFLTNQPGASERLRIFNADLDKPDSFDAAIEGCIGVFHVAHPIDLEGKESEEEKTKKAINGTLGILQACLKAKTVKRVIYTSSASTAMPDDNAGIDIVDESTWTNTASLRGKNSFGVVYAITKTLTEKTCLEFGEKHGLDIVTVLPTWIHGPFISPNVPGSVRASMVMIFGHEDRFNASSIPFVHTDDAARAHIFLFEYPDARGRYICSALQIAINDLYAFLSARYPQYQIPSSVSSLDTRKKNPTFSSKKLSETGFKYIYGLEEMYDDAIRCCIEKGHL
ncbi:hypothetical protein M9H77_33369 [Catharanthus roseus]|uniref:Uncharacterized protein n=1 Tax=Catharanthus roseus TaxID=4058 RepID=A0ACB9ZJ50_CATRO|nr:hypothetical protein M9H77_33369 [Catharanthus roseus]